VPGNPCRRRKRYFVTGLWMGIWTCGEHPGASLGAWVTTRVDSIVIISKRPRSDREGP